MLVVVVGAGFFFWKGKADNTQQAEKAANSSSPVSQEATEKPAQGGMVTSIKEAMGLGKTMQCTYAMDQGGQSFQTQVAVSGEKFKSTSVMGDMTVYGLFDGSTQYSWTTKDKQGFKMDKACLDTMKKTGEQLSQTAGQTPAKDMRDTFDTAQNVNCEPASTVDFSVPKEITFVDQCAMMQESLKMMEQLKGTMPAGFELPSNIPNPAAY